jgi:hypothetical protein
MLYKYIMVHVKGHYVNPDNSHLALFGSTNTSRSYGISGATDNSLAANASRIKGGFKKKRRMTKRKSSKRKKTKRRKYKGGSCQSCATCANMQRGGLHSVTHFNNGYSTGGDLLPSQLALANPVPYQPHNNFINPYYPNERLSY